MMLSNLKDTTRTRKKSQRIGRGPGSGRGKTSCRGEKGAGSRSGYRRRYGYEGGQMRLYMKLPCRGFTRGRFIKPKVSINLLLIDKLYNDGEVVNYKTLVEKGCAPRNANCEIKILSKGDITKNVTIEADKYSKGAEKKLKEKNISFKHSKK